VEPHQVAAAAGFAFVGKLPGGENSGAYEVRATDGSRAVLKFVNNEAPYRPLMDTLRTRGYPVPNMLAAGHADTLHYEVYEYVYGAPLSQPASTHLPQLIALNDMQRDIGITVRGSFRDEMVRSLVEGFDGYCEHGRLRTHDPDLLRRLQRIGDANADIEIVERDAVHHDFSSYNILFDGDRITGVIDWLGATNGDATFDLITLAYYTYDAECFRVLLDAARERSAPRALELYAAHMVLRQVDWSLHFHDATAVQWHTDVGVALLDKLATG
jgi:Ser/Thr protein kinase RdoA (MazF antagonist)